MMDMKDSMIDKNQILGIKNIFFFFAQSRKNFIRKIKPQNFKELLIFCSFLISVFFSYINFDTKDKLKIYQKLNVDNVEDFFSKLSLQIFSKIKENSILYSIDENLLHSYYKQILALGSWTILCILIVNYALAQIQKIQEGKKSIIHKAFLLTPFNDEELFFVYFLRGLFFDLLFSAGIAFVSHALLGFDFLLFFYFMLVINSISYFGEGLALTSIKLFPSIVNKTYRNVFFVVASLFVLNFFINYTGLKHINIFVFVLSNGIQFFGISVVFFLSLSFVFKNNYRFILRQTSINQKVNLINLNQNYNIGKRIPSFLIFSGFNFLETFRRSSFFVVAIKGLEIVVSLLVLSISLFFANGEIEKEIFALILNFAVVFLSLNKLMAINTKMINKYYLTLPINFYKIKILFAVYPLFNMLVLSFVNIALHNYLLLGLSNITFFICLLFFIFISISPKNLRNSSWKDGYWVVQKVTLLKNAILTITTIGAFMLMITIYLSHSPLYDIMRKNALSSVVQPLRN